MSAKTTHKSDIRAQVYGYLARREHTCAELTEKLLRKGHKREEIEEALPALVSEGVISHARFAEDYIESRSGKAYGPARIRMELLHKGVDEEEVERGMRNAGVDWLQIGQRCYERKYNDAKIISMQERFRRRQYLFRRGYPDDMIREIMK